MANSPTRAAEVFPVPGFSRVKERSGTSGCPGPACSVTGGAPATVIRDAAPTTLSPLMSLEVTVPEHVTGTVVGDLSARGARIEGVRTEQDRGIVRAIVPLTKMFGYSTQIRSQSEGRGTFSMRFHRFDTLEA